MIFSENRFPLFRIIRSAASQEERSGAERWRSFAAASAVVGRRQASALRTARDRIREMDADGRLRVYRRLAVLFLFGEK
jgi:hypothetical protein